MYNLIRKDLIVLRFHYLFVLAYAIFFGLLFVTSASGSLLGVLPAVMLTLFACSLEQRNKSSLFIGSLPVRRETIVAAKYATVFVYWAIGLVVVLAMKGVHALLGSSRLTVTVPDLLLTTAVVLLFTSVFYPVYFWLGARGVQIVVVISMIAVAAALIGIGDLSSGALAGKPTWIYAAAGLLLLAVSYRVSALIYKRKDIAS